jgi:hypothetical protein
VICLSSVGHSLCIRSPSRLGSYGSLVGHSFLRRHTTGSHGTHHLDLAHIHWGKWGHVRRGPPGTQLGWARQSHSHIQARGSNAGSLQHRHPPGTLREVPRAGGFTDQPGLRPLSAEAVVEAHLTRSRFPCNAEAQAAQGGPPAGQLRSELFLYTDHQDSAYYRTYRRQLRPSSHRGPRRPPRQVKQGSVPNPRAIRPSASAASGSWLLHSTLACHHCQSHPRGTHPTQPRPFGCTTGRVFFRRFTGHMTAGALR